MERNINWEFQGGVCAQVAEVSVNKRGKLAIHKITCVIDVGKYVNPDTLIAQTEGCIILGYINRN